jgi:hypothetical protein
MFGKIVFCPSCGEAASQGCEPKIICTHCGYGIETRGKDLSSMDEPDPSEPEKHDKGYSYGEHTPQR